MEFLNEPASSIPASGSMSQSFKMGAELTKLSTRQYAKKQVKWIRNKLIPAVNAARGVDVNEEVDSDGTQESGGLTRLYLLDATGTPFPPSECHPF
jgi:tRNA dimethylallyltransferase